MNKLIDDALAMMARVGIPEQHARKKLEIAIFAVMMEEMQSAIQSSGATIGGVTIRSSGQVAATPPPPPPPEPVGKTWKGTGRAVVNEAGERVEIGTWINPAGDIEAARLTKETGVPHIVDPNTGDVTRAGGGAVEISPPKILDPGVAVVDPVALAGIADIRPTTTVKSWK